MMTLTHRIAGITFRTETDVEALFVENDSYGQFLVNGLKPDVHHRICGIDRETLTLPRLSRKDKERISRCVCLPDDDLDVPPLRSPLVRDRLAYCLSRPEQMGLELYIFSVVIRDHVNRKIDFFYTSDCREILLDPGLEHIFRRIFASFLPSFSAVMTHSAGLVRDGSAALFLAPDEGGKTTVMEHSTDGTVLCDDQIILRREDDAVVAHGTPWGHLSGGPQAAKVGAFFLLEKAPQFELIPLKAADAVEYFWKEHLFYRAFLPKNLRLNAFEVIMTACHQAPVYRMRFPEDYVDWDAINAAMVK